MRPQVVPVTMGSPRFRTVEVEGLAVTEAWFAPGTYLAPHIHDRACFAVMLEGSFDVVFRSVAHECPPASVHTEPAAERHAHRIGRAGAHVVVLQPDAARQESLRRSVPLLDAITQQGHAGVAGLAARLARELDAPDATAELAIEAFALEMLVEAARGGTAPRPLPPAWLLRAQEFLHAHRFDRLRLADIAAVAGVHPAHLTRAFRRSFRSSIAAYVRRLRLEWAAERLVATDEPLAAIALRAGFADQSHFTRAFRRYAGTAPGRYRAARSSPHAQPNLS